MTVSPREQGFFISNLVKINVNYEKQKTKNYKQKVYQKEIQNLRQVRLMGKKYFQTTKRIQWVSSKLKVVRFYKVGNSTNQ
jgi:hypothetical protein